MAPERQNVGMWFWLQWLLANVVGTAVYLKGGLFTQHWIARALILVPGTLQWLVLGRKLVGTGWGTAAAWIATSTLGLIAGFFLGMVPMNMAGPDNPHQWSLFALGFALNGAVPGAFQWLVLRRRVCRAGWWVLASSVGTLGCGIIYIRLTRGSDVNLVLGAAAGGAFYGGVTGLGLTCLLRHCRLANEQVAQTE